MTTSFTYGFTMVVVILLGLFAFLPGGSEDSSALNSELELSRRAANTYAGDSLALIYRAADPEKSYSLIADLGLSACVYNLTAEELREGFYLPDELMQISGLHVYQLLSEGKRISAVSFAVNPKRSSSSVRTLSGPRTIRVGGEEEYMVLALLTDSFGNALDEYGVLWNSTERAELFPYKKDSYLNHSWALGNAGTRKGNARVAFVSDNSHTSEEKIYKYSALASRMEIYTDQTAYYADGHNLVKVKTELIKDSYGNIIEDGTLVYLHESANETKGLYTAFTFEGMARFYVRCPQTPGTYEYRASVGSAQLSNVYTLEFKASLDSLPFQWKPEENILEVGPLMGHLGQIIPDGFEVELSIGQDQKRIFSTRSEGGMAFFNLNKANLEQGQYLGSLFAGGLERECEIQIGKAE